jgi:hypothetical protein
MWAGYAACGWALVFAGVSFYWGLGGTLGLATLGREIEQLALVRDPMTVAIGAWGAGAAKVLAALVALAPVQPWGHAIPLRLRLVTVWIVGVLLVVYGIANFVQHGLMAADVVAIPQSFGAEALPWHLLLWDPWWLAGGLLFVAVAWYATRDSRLQAP